MGVRSTSGSALPNARASVLPGVKRTFFSDEGGGGPTGVPSDSGANRLRFFSAGAGSSA